MISSLTIISYEIVTRKRFFQIRCSFPLYKTHVHLKRKNKKKLYELNEVGISFLKVLAQMAWQLNVG